MSQDFMKSKLPPIYKRNNQDAYLDPIRQKLIFVTPEETVRQHIISYLIDELKVPKNVIRVEEPLKHYGISSRGRADILIEVYEEEKNEIHPIAVIECKSPETYLGQREADQMFKYANDLNCSYCTLTNGNLSYCYKYDNEYIIIDKLPSYEKMLSGEYKPLPINKKPIRLTFNELDKRKKIYSNYDIIGTSTKRELAIPLINLYECLIYTDHKLPEKQYKIFQLIEDYGVRLLSHGNASGGKYFGLYRSFIVDYKGSTEFVSLTISAYCTSKRPDYVRTLIIVSIDNEKTAHHSLQLVTDENVEIYENRCKIYHHGKITVGDKGGAKVDGLRKFVGKKYPKIIDGDRFYLGTLTHDRLWNLDDPEVMELVENLISYALIRDEYREYIKNHRK